MKILAAKYIYPGNKAPIKDGVIVCEDDGTIVLLDKIKNFSPKEVTYFPGIICPGFINAHCHLELSYMRGRIKEKTGLVQFIKDLLTIRNERIQIILSEIVQADKEMLKNGIVAVGDISNDDHTFTNKAKSKIYYHTFVEAYGFIPEKAADYFNVALNVFNKAREHHLAASITPHAPYSVPPELFKLIYSFRENRPSIFSIHNQETDDETQFFKDGSGRFKNLMEEFFKIDSGKFNPTGKSSLESILPYLPTFKKTLLVHNTMTTAEDIQLAKAHNPNFYWCTCPNANLYIEDRLPDYNLFLSEKDKICIGTDSLASNHKLSVLEEMKTIQKHFPSISLETLIQWGTFNGAHFLGLEKKLGSFEKGKKPGINFINSVTKDGHLTMSSTVKRII